MPHPQNRPFDIRQAAVADAVMIAAVHVQSWRETYQGIVPQSHLAGLDVAERTAALAWAAGNA